MYVKYVDTASGTAQLFQQKLVAIMSLMIKYNNHENGQLQHCM